MRRGVFVGAAVLALWGLAPRAGWAAPVPDDHGCMGPWVGRGQNSGTSSYWTIELTLTGAPHGARCGTIEYENPACGGFLDGCRLVGEDIHTKETYTHAEADCAPAGRVVIRCEGNQMRYSWIGWEQVDTILHRPEGYSPGANRAPPGSTTGTTLPTPTPTRTPLGNTDVSAETPAPPSRVQTPPGGQPGEQPQDAPPSVEAGGCGCATVMPLGAVPGAAALWLPLLLWCAYRR